ncbi:MAG: hypothetical protein HYR90_01160, partial [Candidatus Andersenbacteria bacterium]|nr:hypothetical protein [Candidatus Andersenbacteria bacterium]
VGQTITVRASGTLLVETDSSTPVEAVVHAAESARELLKVKFTSQYEPIVLSDLVFGSRRGNANLSSVSVTAGAVTVSTTPVNGVSTFSGLSLIVPKDGSLGVSVKGTFTTSGTMISTEDVRLGLESLTATGTSSGSSVYELARTTTGTAGDIAADVATAVTVGSTEGLAVGDVMQINTAQGVSSFTGVVTAVGSATSVTVRGPKNLANCATATCYVTKLATREAVTSKTTAVTVTDVTAIAIDVTSTRGFAIGDIVRLDGESGATDGGGFYTVTAVTDGDTMSVIGLGDLTASPTFGTAATDRVTRMATTSSTQVRALSTITAVTASALEVNSTVGFAAGDLIVVNSTIAVTTRVPRIYTVAAVTDADTLSVIGSEGQAAIPVNSWVTELATTRTTTTNLATDDLVADTAGTITVVSTAGFKVGDVVMLNSTVAVPAAQVDTVYMVSAVPSATTITLIGEAAQTNIPVGSYLTILASSTANGKPYQVHDVEPVITLDALSPGASGTVSGSTSQIVSVFNVLAAGDVALTLKDMTLTRGGNIGTRVAVTAQPKVYDYSSGSLGTLLGTGANWSGTAAGSTSLITFDTPYSVTAGQVLKLAVTVDTSAAIANDTFQVYMNNTGGLAGLFGGLSWYYVATSPSPGTEPTNAAPSTLADTYPVFGNTLRY